jgi:hypothetical protein
MAHAEAARISMWGCTRSVPEVKPQTAIADVAIPNSASAAAADAPRPPPSAAR